MKKKNYIKMYKIGYLFHNGSGLKNFKFAFKIKYFSYYEKKKKNRLFY